MFGCFVLPCDGTSPRLLTVSAQTLRSVIACITGSQSYYLDVLTIVVSSYVFTWDKRQKFIGHQPLMIPEMQTQVLLQLSTPAQCEWPCTLLWTTRALNSRVLICSGAVLVRRLKMFVTNYKHEWFYQNHHQMIGRSVVFFRATQNCSPRNSASVLPGSLRRCLLGGHFGTSAGVGFHHHVPVEMSLACIPGIDPYRSIQIHRGQHIQPYNPKNTFEL